MYETQATQACSQPLAGSGAPNKADVPPVFRTMDDLRRAQDVTRDRLEVLASRLEPLLAPPSPEKDGSAAPPSASQFDELLRGRVYAADATTARLEEILRRLSI